MTGSPIRTLPGSSTHGLAVEVYQRHHDAGAGLCACCGNPVPCAPRARASALLVAAGDDPAAFPAAAWPQRPTHRPTGQAPPSAGTARQPPRADAPPPDGNGADEDGDGFYVSSRRRAMHPDGYGYERDES